ncbi:DNA helicase [Tanacetum coccineum]
MLIKYISKGPDRFLAKISKPIGEASTSGGNNRVQIDKIQNFIDGHFICPHEACWMILDFPIHSREPAVKFMSVNLENMQRIKYRKRDQLRNIVNMPERKKTTSPEWYEYNDANTDGRYLTYLVFPSEFVCRLLPTYRVACEALGLLGDDREWDITLEEATITGSSSELRKLLKYFGLPDPPLHLLEDLKNKLLMEEKNYKCELLMQEKIPLVPKLNTDQRRIYDMIIHALANNQQELIFVYGHGGTGKTFLWKTITSTLRSERKIILAVASSRITLLLLPSRRTTHSRFKISLELTDKSFFVI